MRSFFVFYILFCFSCRSPSPTIHIPVDSPIISDNSAQSCLSSSSHAVFSIHIDGADVGREVRTEIIDSNDNKKQRTILSHSVKNVKLGSVMFQNIFVRREITDLVSGRLNFSSFVKKDQIATHVVQISNSDNNSYNRLIFSSSSYAPPKDLKQDSIELSGNEIFGNFLPEYLKTYFLTASDPLVFSFLDGQLNSPSQLRALPPKSDTVSIEGQRINGFWIDVLKNNSDILLSRFFFSTDGILYAEEYPEFHETRYRLLGHLSFSSETSELLVGLRSNAYIYDPNIASSAVYELISSPSRLDNLDMLSDSLNQTVERVSNNRIILRVHAGSPDKNEPPIDDDLTSSMYILPKDPKIVQALAYLKSGGKSGRLDSVRQLNATSVIARVSLQKNSSKIWSDPNQAAAYIMQYTSTLLPDKRHTFSMFDAVSALDSGSGDCTEHAVLFASLMRANKIPTRLITGMLLTYGGLWAYHMWNSYWDGSSWQAIDPSRLTFRPGALYVPLGRGASHFHQVRDRLSDFMWKTFTGISFNLLEASNNGEILSLAKPLGFEKNLMEISPFNAVVLSSRGNYKKALSILDENIPESSRSLHIKLMRIELLINDQSFETALSEINNLRKETSSIENTYLLDHFELKCLIRLNKVEQAELLLKNLSPNLHDSVDLLLFKAELLFYSGMVYESLDLLRNAVSSYPDNIEAHFLFSYFVSIMDKPLSNILSEGIDISYKALSLSHFSDSSNLETLSRLLLKAGDLNLASFYINHALILSSDSESIRDLQKQIYTSLNCL